MVVLPLRAVVAMASSAETDPTEDLPSLKDVAGKTYVTLRQAAIIVGVSYQTMLRYIKPEPGQDKAKIQTVRVGGQHRIYEEELRRFLTEGNA